MNRRIAALFTAALAGLLVVIGLALSPLGWPALAPYLLVVLLGLSVLVRKARGIRAAQQDDGRTCSCCTSTVFDPIEVI